MKDLDGCEAQPASPELLNLTRRGQLQGFFSAFVLFTLAGEAAAARPSRRMAARDWIDRQAEIARALRKGEISGPEWMDEVTRLSKEIDVAELMAAVSQSQVVSAEKPTTNDPQKRHVQFLDASGAPRRLGYAAALFEFEPHSVVTPHCHKHMVSAHLVVAGKVRVRNFDRVSDEANAAVIRPTRDYVAEVGAVSTMSSARDNVHWFVPQGGRAITFDVVVSNLDPGEPSYEIRALDPVGGRRLPNGDIVAPFMEFDAASAKYTRDV